jgi:hypothetical protein
VRANLQSLRKYRTGGNDRDYSGLRLRPGKAIRTGDEEKTCKANLFAAYSQRGSFNFFREEKECRFMNINVPNARIGLKGFMGFQKKIKRTPALSAETRSHKE